jgi:hypothetical protein
VELVYNASAELLPGLTADLIPASADDGNDGATKAEIALMNVTNTDFEILGTNASSDDVTYDADGGILFTTDGADGDGIILLPHLTAGQSPWSGTTWGTENDVIWECSIRTGAAITNSIIWAGLKLTNTDVIATDDDQAYFRYENGINSGKWQTVDSATDVDNAQDSGVTVAVSTVYHLKIVVISLIPYYYINGVLVATGDALTTAIDLIPYIAIEADGAAEAKTLTIRGQAISRDYA